MRNETWARSAASAMFLAGMLGGLGAACSASGDDGSVVDSTAGRGATSASGQGGDTVGAGGSGGAGNGGGASSICTSDCSTIDTGNPCLISVCNEGSYAGPIGNCVVVPNDGAACDDGEFCTVDDTCAEGVCVGGGINDCGLVPDACQEVVCDESDDACTTEPLPNGTTCESDDLCVLGTTCTNGMCGGGVLEDCFLEPVPSDCYVSECNPANGQCEPVPGNDGLTCTDLNDLCSEGNTCSAGVCGGGTPKDCSSQSNGCNVGVCDTNTGQCTTMQAGQGQACDDQDACTLNETCDMGVCGMGTPVTACSQVADGCCPGNCTAADDTDCDCPGIDVSGTCVYLASTAPVAFGSAQSQCQALGSTWDLCSPTQLCDPTVYAYLGAQGCTCASNGACNGTSNPNIYAHVTGPNTPFYVRDSAIAACTLATTCTQSGLSTTGVPLCCK